MLKISLILTPNMLLFFKAGMLRSLHNFMKIKKMKKAVRFNADYPNISHGKVKNYTGDFIKYELIFLPLYLTGQIFRLISS